MRTAILKMVWGDDNSSRKNSRKPSPSALCARGLNPTWITVLTRELNKVRTFVKQLFTSIDKDRNSELNVSIRLYNA